jgi:hypothetical protein
MARFSVGEKVRVRAAFPPTPPAHLRTPYYIRGHAGTVERICGVFGNPEELAFGRRYGPKPTLYRIRFQQTNVWERYQGGAEDCIEIEIYEFWLEPVEQECTA